MLPQDREPLGRGGAGRGLDRSRHRERRGSERVAQVREQPVEIGGLQKGRGAAAQSHAGDPEPAETVGHGLGLEPEGV